MFVEQEEGCQLSFIRLFALVVSTGFGWSCPNQLDRTNPFPNTTTVGTCFLFSSFFFLYQEEKVRFAFSEK